MIDIIGVSAMADRELPRIKPGSRADIAAVRSELSDWLADQPPAVHYAGSHVLGGLNAALIGPHPHAFVLRSLAADVERLRQAVNVPH